MYVSVVVQAGARRESVRKLTDTAYEIVVREPAQRNLANRRVQQLLSLQIGCSAHEVRLIAGHRSSKKDLCSSITKIALQYYDFSNQRQTY